MTMTPAEDKPVTSIWIQGEYDRPILADRTAPEYGNPLFDPPEAVNIGDVVHYNVGGHEGAIRMISFAQSVSEGHWQTRGRGWLAWLAYRLDDLADEHPLVRSPALWLANLLAPLRGYEG